MKYIVEISDIEGLTCRIKLSLPVRKIGTTVKNSSWKVLDEGFLKYRSGGCEMGASENGKYVVDATGNLVLVVARHWGVKFVDFIDRWSLVNDSGSGEVVQPWALSCKPGQIGWVLIE